MSQVEEIVPGLHKISLPLPMHGLSNVFVYLFRDGRESLLVDTGWNDEVSFERLEEAFSQIDFKIPDLKTIVISHLHPDHIGLATRLKKEAPSSKLLMHAKDAQDMVYTPKAYQIFLEELRTFLKMHGAPDEELEQMIAIVRPLEKQFTGFTKPDTLLEGGEKLQAGKWKIEVIATPGHTRGNVCLYEAGSNILFSGDHILPVITPNISLSPIYEEDPSWRLPSVSQKPEKLDPRKILPSHEFVFEHLGKRIEEIEKHHEERLAEVMLALGADERSGYEVARELTWSVGSFEKLSAWQKRAAITETLAHLEYLKRNGRVFELHEEAGETVRYSKIAN